MTVQTTTNVAVFQGNGSADTFSYNFKVLEASHLVVQRRLNSTGEIDKTYTSGEYSITGLDSDSGSITLNAGALASGYSLIIQRIVPYKQELDIVNQGGFYPESVEDQLDVMVMGLQQVNNLAERAILFPAGAAGSTLPSATERANKVLGFSASGALLTYATSVFTGPAGPPGYTTIADAFGFIPPALATIGTADASTIINNALADVDVSCVILPAGTFWVAKSIVIPDGKTLRGMGRELTWVRALPGFTKSIADAVISTDYTNRGAIPPSTPNLYQWSDNVRVEDLSVHCERVGFSSPQVDANRVGGVYFERGRNCWARNVDVYECTAYGFYWKGTAQTAGNTASGGSENCRVFGANVGFEAHFADGVTWLNCEYGDGDAIITPEAMFHPFGANNVTAINCKGRGRAPGWFVVTIGAVNIKNPRLIACDLETTGGSPVYVVSGSATVVGAEIIGGRYVNLGNGSSATYGAQLYNGTIRITGAYFEGPEAGILTAATAIVDAANTVAKGVAIAPTAAAYGILSNNTANTWTGGELIAEGDAELFPIAGPLRAINVRTTPESAAGSSSPINGAWLDTARQIADANDADSDGVTFAYIGSLDANRPPTTNGDAYLMTLSYNESFSHQLGFSPNSAELFMRGQSGGAWGAWKRVAVVGDATYADNAAALAGGLTAGDFYNTATGEVRRVV